MRIRYPLEALIKTKQWELDSLRQKMLETRNAVNAVEAAIEKLREEIGEAEEELAKSGTRGRIILIERRRLVAAFVKDRRRQYEDERVRLEREQESLSMAMQETTTVRRALRALERHRERFRDNFDSMAQRNLEKALDDNWLSRKLALNNE